MFRKICFTILTFVLIGIFPFANQAHAETEISGNIESDTTWTLANSPYKIVDTLQVFNDTTLTIEEGVEVKTANGKRIKIAGTLIVNGTNINPVTFTSLTGKWGGIEFIGSNNSQINNSVIENADTAVDLKGISVVSMVGNIFKNNEWVITDSYGYQRMYFVNNTVHDNSDVFYGIRTTGDDNIFRNNIFSNNSSVFSFGYYFGNTAIDNNNFINNSFVIKAPEEGYGYGVVSISDNWWNTTDTDVIDNLIEDKNDDVALQILNYLPIKTSEINDIGSSVTCVTPTPTPTPLPTPSDATPPTVNTTSPSSGATGVVVNTTISVTFSEAMDSTTINTSTFLVNGGLITGTVSYDSTAKKATFTPSSTLSYSTTYTVTITTGVMDRGGNVILSNYTWSFTTSSAPDTTAPSGSVTVSGGSSYINSTTITLNLSATDSVGVTGYYLSNSSSTPSASDSGWTSVTSTTSYSGSVSYSLSGEGSKRIYAWYKDAAENVSSVASTTITLDTTTPTVTISSPTSSSTYTATSNTIRLGGGASDSSSGISSVSWSNDRGGDGTATGTASWTVSVISLSSGDNKITVTAKDGAGNSGTDTITVTYTVTTTPKPSPTAQPTPTRTSTLPPLPSPVPQVSPTATLSVGSGSVSGNVDDQDGNALQGVAATIVGANDSSPTENSTETDESGYYEFSGLSKGNYTLTYEKNDYQTKTKSITLKEGEEKDIGTTVLEEEGDLGKIYGYVVDIKGNPLESVKLKLKGLKTGAKGTETSDGEGFFEFLDLRADTYILTAQKKRYRKAKQTIILEEGESREMEIELGKTSKRIKRLLREVKIQ